MIMEKIAEMILVIGRLKELMFGVTLAYLNEAPSLLLLLGYL